MTNMKNDSILVFEYFTASGEDDKSIISEAEALIRGLLDDLKEFDVSIILNNEYKFIADGYDNAKANISSKTSGTETGNAVLIMGQIDS